MKLAGVPDPPHRKTRLPVRVRLWLAWYRYTNARQTRAYHRAAGHSCSLCDAYQKQRGNDDG